MPLFSTEHSKGEILAQNNWERRDRFKQTYVLFCSIISYRALDSLSHYTPLGTDIYQHVFPWADRFLHLNNDWLDKLNDLEENNITMNVTHIETKEVCNFGLKSSRNTSHLKNSREEALYQIGS